MKFEFLPDVAIADIAFRAEGKTREELFENCALATTACMVKIAKIPLTKKKKIIVEGTGDKELLYNFLEEIVYIKDVEGLLFGKFSVKFSHGELEAECIGSPIGKIGRGNLDKDVKAITMHMFEIKKEKENWVATVVVDI